MATETSGFRRKIKHFGVVQAGRPSPPKHILFENNQPHVGSKCQQPLGQAQAPVADLPPLRPVTPHNIGDMNAGAIPLGGDPGLLLIAPPPPTRRTLNHLDPPRKAIRRDVHIAVHFDVHSREKHPIIRTFGRSRTGEDRRGAYDRDAPGATAYAICS